MPLGESLDMGLIDDRAVPGRKALAWLSAPVKIRIDDDGLWHVWRAVALVETQIGGLRADLIAIDSGIPVQRSNMSAGVRVEQQFVGVEPMSRLGLVRAVNA